MSSDVDFAQAMVRAARTAFSNHVLALSLDDALFAAGGWRSVLGVLKHTAAWSEVYHSYAFEPDPRHWAKASWPRGLIDEVELSPQYLNEVLGWLDHELVAWADSLSGVAPGELDQQRPVHWGGTLPLAEIVVAAIQHSSYHLGELNMLLSIRRGEAWEWSEEVEENHIDTFGHGVRANWMDDATAEAVQEQLRASHEQRKAVGS